MFEERDSADEGTRNRHLKASRPGTPRASRSTRVRKKAATSYGGKHQRRNKHWSW